MVDALPHKTLTEWQAGYDVDKTSLGVVVPKEVIDLDTVKVGELVVDTVRDKIATGRYGGQPLLSSYATTGKGYAARLVSK